MSTVLNGTGVTYADGTTDVTHTPASTGLVSSSGTTVVVTTSIPSWAKRVTIALLDVNTSATANLLMQLGTSSGYETSGYTGSVDSWATTASTTAWPTTGCELTQGPTNLQYISGVVTLILVASNTWVITFTGGANTATSGVAQNSQSGGSKTLSGALTSVRITTTAGTATVSLSTSVLYD